MEFVNFLEKHITEDVQIMGFAEPNINWHLETEYRDVARVFKSVYINGNIITATSPMFILGRYKPGGVMIGLSRKILSIKTDHG